MIKNEQKKILATHVLHEMSTYFWSMTPGMSVSELSRLTGLNRRSLARYLSPDSDVDLPIASLHIMCSVLKLTFDDVIPCYSTILSIVASELHSSSEYDNADLKEINDCYVVRLLMLIKARHPTDTFRHLYEDIHNTEEVNSMWNRVVEDSYEDRVSECGLRKAFRKKGDGRYPLMSLSLAVIITDTLSIHPGFPLLDI